MCHNRDTQLSHVIFRLEGPGRTTPPGPSAYPRLPRLACSTSTRDQHGNVRGTSIGLLSLTVEVDRLAPGKQLPSAPVAQQAEASGSNPDQCRFDPCQAHDRWARLGI